MQTLRRAAPLLLAALVLAACGKEPAQPAKPPEPKVVRDVTVGIVTSAEVEEAAEVMGTVKSRTSTTLSSKIVGKILAIHAREGSEV
jgi:multidrug efflux pump subunit AcrA (membrane-fusion protein)